MQKRFIAIYLIIFITLLIMMNLSRSSTEKMRGGSVAAASPIWEKILSFKHFILHPFQPSPFTSQTLEEEKLQLLLEKQLLQTEIGYLQKQLSEQLLLNSQITEISAAEPEAGRTAKRALEKSIQKKMDVLNYRLQTLPARVIFRSFDAWDQALWINVGESSNQNKEEPIAALNSPVVVGNAIVGIIDYIGKNQSRVRLITDNRLNPSVRASRGGEQDFYLSEQIEGLLLQISNKKQIPLPPEERKQLSLLLTRLKQGLQPFKRNWYLAKGELLGSSSSSSRAGGGIILKGTGFNFDFPDSDGDSRDLRSGKSLQHPDEQPVPILKIDDMLITTGMDGIFPPGFQVAMITKIELLKEGDYFYELEAHPVALPLEEISLVFVLPPIIKEDVSFFNKNEAR